MKQIIDADAVNTEIETVRTALRGMNLQQQTYQSPIIDGETNRPLRYGRPAVPNRPAEPFKPKDVSTIRKSSLEEWKRSHDLTPENIEKSSVALPFDTDKPLSRLTPDELEMFAKKVGHTAGTINKEAAVNPISTTTPAASSAPSAVPSAKAAPLVETADPDKNPEKTGKIVDSAIADLITRTAEEGLQEMIARQKFGVRQ